ncbi:MAG: VOC family protein [Acidimicrobiales bacterium]
MAGVRLRQVALVAADIEPVIAALCEELSVEREPYRDPGISVFGLQNAVMAVGDTFLEVVSPVGPDTTAGRYLERRGGDGGYMAIFQVEDLAAARARIAELGIRVVWQSDHEDIAGTHLHPKDLPGALVSIDWASPPDTWRWAGPDWTGQVPRYVVGGIVGVTVQTERPRELAELWAKVLDRTVEHLGADAVVAVDGGQIRFVEPTDTRGEGICALEVALGGAEHWECEIAGVKLVVGPVHP